MDQSGYSLVPAWELDSAEAKAVVSLSGGESRRREKMPVPEPSSIKSSSVEGPLGATLDWMYLTAGAGYDGLALRDGKITCVNKQCLKVFQCNLPVILFQHGSDSR